MSDEKAERPKGKMAKFGDGWMESKGRVVRPGEKLRYLGSDWEECVAAGRRILARREREQK